jgi:adenylate cyclase
MMDLSNKIIDYIMERRMSEQDIKRMLGVLTSQGREDFMGKVAGILGKVTALLQASKKVSDTLSLDLILSRTIAITSEAVDADRGTLFLNDPNTSELYSRVADGDLTKEIRFPNNLGIAGEVFQSGEACIIDDAYSHPSFNPDIDRKTDFRTRNMLCAPIFNTRKDAIGVIQLLNKQDDDFTEDDLSVLEAITSQVSAALQNAQLFEQVERQRHEESQLLEMTAAISSELQLLPLLNRIIDTSTKILDADRGTLFLHDEATDELWSQVAQGMDTAKEIRFPSSMGIAGRVFSKGETINIADAYADDRFNPEVDKKTGYRTETILCMPVVNKQGRTIGVSQVLNKAGGPFKADDEKKLRAFSAQAAIAIENAKLFDEVLNIKNYNESILESLSNGVITLNTDRHIEKCNAAALRILHETREHLGEITADDLFGKHNAWVVEAIEQVFLTNEPSVAMDTEIILPNDTVSVNLTVVPLQDINGELIGSMIVLEDITSAKRLQGTLARYLPKEVADKVMDSEALLGGQVQVGTVLFSDIRNFTSISERLGAAGTVTMLNEYFTRMVDIISSYEGILDKYIGDALLAVFGVPFPTGRDEDNAVTAAIDMLRDLVQFNIERTEAGKEPIAIGIGINSQEILAGNIGSLKRMDYTVIGDGVNLAARLEGANKYYSTSLLISEFTLQALQQQYVSWEVDVMRVKGKSEPVSVFEILDYHTEETFPNRDAVVEVYTRGLALYRGRNWADAEACFQKALSLNSYHSLPQVYIERCRHFAENPPDDNWDGVWTMTQK